MTDAELGEASLQLAVIVTVPGRHPRQWNSLGTASASHRDPGREADDSAGRGVQADVILKRGRSPVQVTVNVPLPPTAMELSASPGPLTSKAMDTVLFVSLSNQLSPCGDADPVPDVT